MAVFTGSLDNIDTEVIRRVQALAPISAFMQVITHAGDTITLIAVTALVSILMYFATGRKRPAAALWINVGIAYAINNGTKYLFARARPDFSSVYVDPDSYSFPSGHAMVSAAVYGLTAYLLSIAFPKYRIGFRIAAIVLVLTIGISRMYLDAHWPSDVLAGFAAGWILVSLMVRWYEGENRTYRFIHSKTR